MDLKSNIATIKHMLPNAKIIACEFNGCGDSGNMDSLTVDDNEIEEKDTGFEPISEIIDYLINEKVNWNFEDGEGGGFSITIDLVENTINVGGYYNEVVQQGCDPIVINMDGD